MRFFLDIPICLPGGVEKKYDLILPEGKPEKIPLLVWIHGGGWCSGEKRVFNEFERFVHRGYAVLSIAYRFTQDAPFPAQLIDCKFAIRWARAHAEEYGYNAEKILVGGSSAGAHLSSLLGLTNDDPQYDVGEYLTFSSRVQAVMDAFGPADLQVSLLPLLEEPLVALHGNIPEKVREASPICRIKSPAPPFLILHTIGDPVVPVEQSRRFCKALIAAGAQPNYLEIPGKDHGYDSLEAYRLITKFVEENLPLNQ